MAVRKEELQLLQEQAAAVTKVRRIAYYEHGDD